MAILTVNSNVSVKQVRRHLRAHGSSFTVRMVNGRLFTYHLTTQRSSNTSSQLLCRALLAEANKLARRDIKILNRADYWTRQAALRGYKTAMGCARAHYVALLKNRHANSTTNRHKYVFANNLSKKYYANATKKCKFASVNLNLFKRDSNAKILYLSPRLHGSVSHSSLSPGHFVWTAVRYTNRRLQLYQNRRRTLCP